MADIVAEECFQDIPDCPFCGHQLEIVCFNHNSFENYIMVKCAICSKFAIYHD